MHTQIFKANKYLEYLLEEATKTTTTKPFDGDIREVNQHFNELIESYNGSINSNLGVSIVW